MIKSIKNTKHTVPYYPVRIVSNTRIFSHWHQQFFKFKLIYIFPYWNWMLDDSLPSFTNVYAIESCVMLRLWLLLMFIDSIMAYVSLIWSCIHLVIARPDLLKVNTFLKKLPQLWTNLHDKYVTLHHFYEQYVQHWIIFSIFDAIFATKTNIWKKKTCVISFI